MAITGTGRNMLDRLIRYWATLRGGKGDRADDGGPWNILDNLFIEILDHLDPSRLQVGYHWSVGITGDLYADDQTSAFTPEIRVFNVLAGMNAWAAPDGSMALIINPPAANQALYVRTAGAWTAH
jgi:hypothetical protein